MRIISVIIYLTLSHLYADDTILYCSSSSALKSLELLQSAFDTVQFRLAQLKLVLNAEKTKNMLFSNGKQLPSHLPRLSTVYGVEIEMVTSYKYLGILIDENLSFKLHINKLVSKLKLKLSFFFLEINHVFHCKSENIWSPQLSYPCWTMETCFLWTLLISF